MGELIDYFTDIALELLCIPLVSEPMFRRGFLVAMFVAFVIGRGARMFLHARGQIIAFYSTIQPSLKPSPSGYERMNGCMGGMITIGILGAIAAFSTWVILYALTR